MVREQRRLDSEPAERPSAPVSEAILAATAPLQICCFGRFEVIRGGVPIQRWRRDRARALLKYLVVQRRPVPRDALLELLWSGVPTSVAAGYLRVVMHALRQAVGTWDGHDYVRIDSEQLFLDPAAPIWVDTEVFMAHVHAAEVHVREGRSTEASQEYTDAEAIYRDDYLVDDALEHWTVLRREELKDRYQVVLTRLADFCIERGDFVGGIARCHKLLAQDKCREDAYQRLMYCHSVLGQRGRAVRWYEMCQAALSELGIHPGERTRTMYQRITSEETVEALWMLLGGEPQRALDGLRP
jgi:SARP family transcriptional regulator, regulator of embCAB operon